jgi:YidC/Oxa1 family membrane protein insertase
MEKRALLAVFLSISVLMLWQLFFVPQQKEAQKAQKAEQTAIEQGAPAPLAAQDYAAVSTAPISTTSPQAKPAYDELGNKVVVATGEKDITVATDTFIAVLSSRGGTIKSFHLKNFSNKDGSPLSLLNDSGLYRALAIGVKNDFSYSNNNFQVIGSDIDLTKGTDEGTISFRLDDKDFSILRTYTFRNGSHAFDLVDSVEGLPEYSITLGADLGISNKDFKYAHVGPVLQVDTDRNEYTDRKLKEPKVVTGTIKWAALQDKYFFSALAPKNPMGQIDIWKLQDSKAISLSGRSGINSFTVYVGPKIIDDLKLLNMELENVVDFGFFSVISRPIFWMLQRIYSVLGNYGWSILLLTILIRVPFIPIVNKGQQSMKKMQEVQPKIKDLREKYKKDSAKMNQEVMALYKKHKVNPMGGCLPLVLQIPVFFALYKVLLIAIELRGAPWAFWIVDLAEKDPYFVLPIVMGASMFLQQKLTPSTADPKQQKIMLLMPIIFTFFFLNFPSGLVLYWLMNNLLSIGQQLYVNKTTPAAT